MSDGTTGATTFNITLPAAREVFDGVVVAEKYIELDHKIIRGDDPMQFTLVTDRMAEHYETFVCYVGPLAFVAYALRARKEQQVSGDLWREICRRIEFEQGRIAIPCSDRYFDKVLRLTRSVRRNKIPLLILGAALVLATVALLTRQW
jgi:hypothetical protein